MQVSGLSGVTAISAGVSGSLALKNDGTVWTWAAYTIPPIGAMPVQVSGLSGVTSISAGGSHYLALKGDGTVRAWGSDLSGQLGDGRTLYRLTPAPVIPPGSTDLRIRK